MGWIERDRDKKRETPTTQFHHFLSNKFIHSTLQKSTSQTIPTIHEGFRESGEGRRKERTARDNRGDIKKLPPFFRLSFRKILYKLKKHSLRRKEFTKGRGTKRRDEREGGMGVEEGGREEDKYA